MVHSPVKQGGWRGGNRPGPLSAKLYVGEWGRRRWLDSTKQDSPEILFTQHRVELKHTSDMISTSLFVSRSGFVEAQNEFSTVDPVSRQGPGPSSKLSFI